MGLEYPISSLTDTARMGDKNLVINFDDENICIKFKTKADAQKLREVLENIRRLHPKSVFSERTEESSASQYFQFYGYLSQQQNMMQDYVRTSTYQKAILSNVSDFQVRNGSSREIQFFFLTSAVPLDRTKWCWMWVPVRAFCHSLPFRLALRKCTQSKRVIWHNTLKCWWWRTTFRIGSP